MTVQDIEPTVTHLADGFDTSFPFVFRVDDISWLGIDFLVDFDQFFLNPDQDNSPGGSANYLVAPLAGQSITIARVTPNTQELDYTRYGPFDSESTEDELDKLTMQIQDLQTVVDGIIIIIAGGGGAGSNILPGNLQGDITYWDTGATRWTPTSDAQWDQAFGQFRFALDKSINWFNSLAASIKLLEFTPVAATLGSWPDVDSFTEVGSSEFLQTEAGQFKFNDTGTTAYISCRNNAASGGIWSVGVTYGTPYVPTDANSPLLIQNTPDTIAWCWGDSGQKVYMSVGTGGAGHRIQQRSNSGTAYNPGLGDLATLDSDMATVGGAAATCLDVSADGFTLWWGQGQTVYQVDMSTAWDLSTGVDGVTSGALAGFVNMKDFQWSPDGLKLYILMDDHIEEWEAFPAFDITTLTDSGREIAGVNDPGQTTCNGFDVSPDSTVMIIQNRRDNQANLNDSDRYTGPGGSAGSPATEGFFAGDPVYPTQIDGSSISFHGAYAFPTADGTVDQVLSTDGAGVLSFVALPGGGFTGFGIWRYRTAVDAFPTAGRMQFDNLNIDIATNMYINEVNDGGTDVSNFLALLVSGDLVYVQVQDVSSQFVIVEVGTPVLNADVWTFPITQVEGQGTTPTNNTQVAIVASLGAGAGVTAHSALTGLVAPADDHTQYAHLPGRAGGQSLFGGTAAADNLILEANTAVGVAAGRIQINSAVEFTSISATGAPYAFNYDATEAYTGTFIGGGLNMSGTMTSVGGTFIYESFRGAPTISMNGNPGFAAYTVLQALPVLIAGPGAGNNPLPPLIVNAGATVRNPYSGTRTVSSVVGVNFASRLETTISGAVMNCTDWVGLTVAPTWSTVSGSTINFGNVIGVDVKRPAQSLFGGSAGTERMASFHGLKVANPGINNGFGTMPCSAVRSEITLGTNRYFLLNAGTAPSDHGAAHMYFDDNFGTVYGGNGITNFDSWISWNAGSVNKHRLFLLANSTSLYTSNPNAARILFDINNGALGEFTFNCAKFSLGAQAGSNGNQVGNFVAGARSTLLAGEWSDFLLTQAGNITVDHAMGGVFGWTVNAPSITLGTGTVTTAGALNIGGNVNQGSVNRFGVRIISNPSGGSGVNAALWITAGLSRFDGRVDINAPIALGGGAAPTLGTIGGAGPTAAAQAQWVEVDINGVAHWLPAWT